MRDRYLVFIGVLTTVIVIAYIFLYIIYIMPERENRQNTISIAGFEVLDEDSVIINNYKQSDADLRGLIFNKALSCESGKISYLNLTGYTYIYLCMLDNIMVNSTQTPINTSSGMTPSTIIIGGLTRSIISIGGLGSRILYRVYSFNITLPSNTRQGLAYFGGDSYTEYYMVVNKPYIYFQLNYLKGLGNVSFTLKITISINGENLTDGYIIQYSTNSNVSVVISPLETPLDLDRLGKTANDLKPLKYLDTNKTVNIKYYVELYARGRGEYSIILTIGYPGVMIVNLPSKP